MQLHHKILWIWLMQFTQQLNNSLNNIMGWDVIAGLIAQYGIPFVEKLIAKWTNKNPVTSAEWADLMSVALNTPLSQMRAALSRAGISESDPNAVILLKQAA